MSQGHYEYSVTLPKSASAACNGSGQTGKATLVLPMFWNKANRPPALLIPACSLS
jgi:hypothetical protein